MPYTPVQYRVYVDWDNIGDSPDFTGAYDEITNYVKEINITSGINDPNESVAFVGMCELTLNNLDKRFSPLNTASPLYGNLTSNKPVLVTMTSGPKTWTLFTGFTRSIAPDTSTWGPRECILSCADLMGVIQDEKISIPLQENINSGALARHVVNSALKAPAATGTITFDSNPANNDTITIVGRTYTFKTSLTGNPYEILIGTRREDTAANLAAAINLDTGIGTKYGNSTTRLGYATAEYIPELPTRATMWHEDAIAPISPGPLTIVQSTAWPYAHYAYRAVGALNDSFTHSFWLQKGTYTLYVLGGTANNCGILELTYDGPNIIGSLDWYSAGTVNGVLKSVGTVSFSTHGYHILNGRVSGKNASSSGYQMTLVKYWLKQAAD